MNDERTLIDRALGALALCVGVCLMFVPLVFVYRYQLEHPALTTLRDAEATIGVGVILRTTFRRLLRSGTTNLLRTSVGAFSRTTARTMTRRVARVSVRLILGFVARRAPDGAQDGGGQDSSSATAETTNDVDENEWALSALSAVIGFAALAASFAWVTEQRVGSAAEGASPLYAADDLSLIELSLYAALPLLCYIAVAMAVAQRFGAGMRVRTAIDGLLLQAYFAGAGSFLPMTTDIEYATDDDTRSRIACRVLLGLYLLHLALRAASVALDSDRALLVSALVLVYCFVYSFPIRPLEGYWIWNGSKLLWAVLWLPILVSFVSFLPASILNVL